MGSLVVPLDGVTALPVDGGDLLGELLDISILSEDTLDGKILIL